MTRKKYSIVPLLVLAVWALAMTGGWIYEVSFAPQPEIVPPYDGTLWSLTEGPYEYISDGTLEAFEPIYATGSLEAVGQVQYKGLAVICFMGIPKEPVDNSGSEAWCIAWRFNAKTGLWEPGAPYLWGTMGEYEAWRVEVGLD